MGLASSATRVFLMVILPYTQRDVPSDVSNFSSSTPTTFNIYNGTTTIVVSAIAITNVNTSSKNVLSIAADVASGLTAGNAYILQAASTSAYLQIDVEM